MKTREEWIDTLPEDILERAYKYTEKGRLEILQSSLFDAIFDAFLWRETSEGSKFWSLVAISKFDEARQLLTQNNE